MSNEISIIAAFTAGILSFLSPCVLPIIPGYISLITGLTTKDLIESEDKKSVTRKTLLNSVFFILGFTGVFILLQIVLQGFVTIVNQKIFNYIFGAIIIIFGFHTAGIIKIKFLYYQKGMQINKKKWGLIGSFAIGLAFGFAWTPCIGPILAAILALAAQETTIFKGTVLLLIYSAGLGIPFLISAIFVEWFLKFITKFKKMMRAIEIISGLLLIFIGILIMTNRFASFSL